MAAQLPPATPVREAPLRLAAGDRCVRGEPALRLLDEPSFVAAWSRLYAACRWATPFQAPAFVMPWYRCYAGRFEPLVLVRTDGRGGLLGLMTLAISRSDGAVVAAGAWQAEYQGWLGTDDDGDFVGGALSTVRNVAPNRPLRFGYLSPGAPLDWLRASPLARVCSVVAHTRPIMQFGDGSDIAESLRKKANKKRVRDMEREVGPAEVRRVTDPGEFAAWLRQAAVFHDTRQLALHDIAPFESDPLKAPFHALLATDPRHAYVSVLTAGRTLASMQIGLLRGDELQLVFLAHNPFLARYSPGKIHLYRMAQQLMQAGVGRLDLTAGGEAYKERFATDAETVYELSMHTTAGARRVHELRTVTARVAKHALKRLRLEPGRTLVAARERLNPLRLLGALLGRGLPIETAPTADPAGQLERLARLLAHRPALLGPSRRARVAAALKRIEETENQAPTAERMPPVVSRPTHAALAGGAMIAIEKGKL